MTKDLRDFASATYTLPITCDDRMGSQIGSEILTVNIVNVKQPPEITNLPDSIEVLESMSGENELFRVSIKIRHI